MKHDVLCGWLGLNPEHWPPNHYTLLGLAPGDADVARIEQSVHERMARLRCYQICNPEQATEGMNRLAQAFLCLTDPKAKTLYDAGLASAGVIAKKRKTAVAVSAVIASPGEPAPRRLHAKLPAALTDTSVDPVPTTQVHWKTTVPPPPVRAATVPVGDSPPPQGPEGTPVSEVVPAIEPPAEAKPPEATPVAAAPVVQAEASRSGPLAAYKGFSPALLRLLTCRRGLGTKRALYQRICKTRRLLYAWGRAGKYLRKPKRKLNNPAEEKEFGRALAAVGEHLRGFPKFLGRPGQPGYRVACRARLAFVVDWLNALDAEQRELLAQDWAAGQTLLSSHRQFLRKEARAVRGVNGWHLGVRAVACDFPLSLALLAAFLVAILTIFTVLTR